MLMCMLGQSYKVSDVHFKHEPALGCPCHGTFYSFTQTYLGGILYVPAASHEITLRSVASSELV